MHNQSTEIKNHNGSRRNEGSIVAIIANTITSECESENERRQVMEWMRRRCCNKKGNGATLFRGVRVKKRDLRGAKEAINGR